jgi:hypothetical protein
LDGALGLVGFQELGLDDIPVVDIKPFFDESFKPCGSVPEAHLELQNFAVRGPVANGGSVIDTDDE